jgi:glycogen debranching enzyme
MARPLAHDALSLTGSGVGLVTGRDGNISPGSAEGLILDDRRALSQWSLEVQGFDLRRAGWQRDDASCDRLLFTLSERGVIDPVGLLERARRVDAHGLREQVTIRAYARRLELQLVLTAERDDQAVFDLGDTGGSGGAATQSLVCSPGGGRLAAPQAGPLLAIDAPGWACGGGRLTIDAVVEAGGSWATTIDAAVTDDRPRGRSAVSGTTRLTSDPPQLGRAVADSLADLRALTLPIGGHDVIAAGSPYFLALFGRDSMIAGMQFLLESHRPLLDVLTVLAEHQAVGFDVATQAEPGRILHELRLGRAGVFGLEPRTPYYGAVDTSALFVIALGEAARWGAPRDAVAGLLPAARAALEWCERHGDVDGDGFIESVPHQTGLTNLGWKDSADSMIDTDGRVIVGRVALAEVQAYWYRGLRTIAQLERWTGVGAGTAADAAASDLAARFRDRFVYETDDGPFVGLALDGEKRLLSVRASNAGHVLWSGMLDEQLAMSVAEQLGGADLFSGWGVRTIGRGATGYNPFGYHRGSVWPHDTAIAMHGASRIGHRSVVRRLGDGLISLGAALDGQLPELLSGLGIDDVGQPVPYAAACRPQAWAAGAMLMAARALLGLEPDVTTGTLRIAPSLDPSVTITVEGLRLGEHHVSFTANGTDVADVVAPDLDVITGEPAVLARGPWGRASAPALRWGDAAP